MPRWQVAYLAGCMAVTGGALAYLLCDFGGWPLLMYDASDHRWLVANAPSTATVSVYPGMLIWGLFGATTCAALSVAIGRRVKRPLSDRVLHLFAGWSLTAVLVTALYFLWGLWPWV